MSIRAEFKSPDEVAAIYQGNNVESSMLSVAVRNSQTSGEAGSFSCVVDTAELTRSAVYSKVSNSLGSLSFAGKEPVSVLGSKQWKKPTEPTQFQRKPC